MPFRGKIAGYVVPAFMLLIGLLAAVGSWGALRRDRAIERDGARAVAIVTRLEVVEVHDGNDYLVHYRFRVPEGGVVTAQRGLPERAWRALSEGAPLPVAYDPANPRRNFPVGHGVTSVGLALFASVIGLVVAGMGALGVFGRRD